MTREWTFEESERNDLLPAINLLMNAEDEDRRQIYSDLRESQKRDWECRLALAQEYHRRQNS